MRPAIVPRVTPGSYSCSTVSARTRVFATRMAGRNHPPLESLRLYSITLPIGDAFVHFPYWRSARLIVTGVRFIAMPATMGPTETSDHGYSMRSSRMIGNLWITLGINSRSKSPPASVAIEIKKVLPTTAAVMLGPG